MSADPMTGSPRVRGPTLEAGESGRFTDFGRSFRTERGALHKYMAPGTVPSSAEARAELTSEVRRPLEWTRVPRIRSSVPARRKVQLFVSFGTVRQVDTVAPSNVQPLSF
jgi:hypothetical protein